MTEWLKTPISLEGSVSCRVKASIKHQVVSIDPQPSPNQKLHCSLSHSPSPRVVMNPTRWLWLEISQTYGIDEDNKRDRRYRVSHDNT